MEAGRGGGCGYCQLEGFEYRGGNVKRHPLPKEAGLEMGRRQSQDGLEMGSRPLANQGAMGSAAERLDVSDALKSI